MNQVNLIGAGGHCRSLISLLESLDVSIGGIYDDNFRPGEMINGYPLKGILDEVPLDRAIILALGKNSARAEVYHRFAAHILVDNVIHPSALIDERTSLGKANQIFPFAFLNANVQLGDNNIINTRATLEHEVVVGDHNHISVGTILCGRVSVGDNCFIGAGAVVIDRVKIGNDITVGANSVVIKDLTEPGVYVGNPVRKIK